MQWLWDMAKLVGGLGIISGGVIAIGGTKFLSKKEFEKRKDSCQREMITRIDKLSEDQKEMHKEQIANMQDIKQFMGKVDYYIATNGGRK